MAHLISHVGSWACLVFMFVTIWLRPAVTVRSQENGAVRADAATVPAIPIESPLLAKYPASRCVTDPRNGHAYQRIDVSTSWHDARRLCQEVGGHLATVTSAEESQFVFTNFATDHVCWLGATDEAREGTWRWITDEPFEYQNWFTGEPSNGGDIEDFLILGNTLPVMVQGSQYGYRFGSQWNDHAPDGTYHGVPIAFPLCEWESAPPAVAQRLVARPDGNVEDLYRFVKELSAFRPDTSPNSRLSYGLTPATLREAASQIIEEEKNEFSDAYQTALHILLEDRIGSARRGSPSQYGEAIELVDAFLRAKVEPRRLDHKDAQLALWAARVLETADSTDQARQAYSRFARRMAGYDMAEIAEVRQIMEGALRRLDATGQPLVLQGVTCAGGDLNWSSYRGKTVQVLFWRSDQAESRTALEAAQWNYDCYHDLGFDVVGINVDEDRAALTRFLQEEPVPWHNVLDITSEGAHPTSKYYGVVDLPKSFLVDADGKVLQQNLSLDDLTRMLGGVLGDVRYTESLSAPPDAPQGPLRCLDVASKANRALTISTFVGDLGNNLVEMPLGERPLGGVTYRVTDALIQLRGTYLPDLARSVRGIPVGGKIRSLYVLQGTQWGASPHTVVDMTVIGEYRVYYEDGTRAKIPIRYGDSVRDWWNIDSSLATPHAEVAWTGANSVSRNANVALRLYSTGWRNPQPDKKVDHIDFVSTSTLAAPFCLAMTVEESAE